MTRTRSLAAALASSALAAVTYYATYELDGGTASQTAQTYSASGADTSAVWVANSGKLTLTNCTLRTTGNTSSQDSSSFYGLNAGLLVTSGSATMEGGSITTTGTGANGAFATGTGASVTLSKVTIKASADGGHAVMATQAGTMTLTDVDMTTTGGSSSAIATDRGGGTIVATGGTVHTSGGNSAGIYSTGSITANGTSFVATVAETAVIEGANSITLVNSSLTTTKEKWGVMIYQSMSGDAQGTHGVFTMTGGALTYSPASGPLFYVNNTTAVVTLTGVAITNGSATLLQAAAGSWGNSGSNGGTVVLRASGQALPGNIVVDSISSVTATLKDGSSLTGAVNAANTAKSVALVLDGTSTWHVTANSALTSLTETAGTTSAALSNIDDGGHTVTYDSTASASAWLAGGTYVLKGGGLLAPKGSTTACSFTATPSVTSFPASGGTGTVTVTGGTGCTWTAVSDSSWLGVSSGASGSGSGTVAFAVAANPGSSARTGTLTVAGKSVSITEAAGTSAGPTATLSASPASIAAGGSSTLTWTTTGASTVSIDQGVGTVNPNGSLPVSPVTTTLYTLTATASGGAATASATVAVVASRTLFVPIVLSASGLKCSSFTSELTLTNRGITDASVTFLYTAAIGSGTGTASVTLPAGRQRVVPDAVAYLRGLGIPVPASGNQGGTLRVSFSGLSAGDAAGATVRTTTAVASGRAGLAYAGVPVASALGGTSYLCGLRQNLTDRSNVAVQNAGGPADGPITLHLTVLSGNAETPAVTALPEVTLGPGEFSQVSEVLISNGLALSNGMVRVERLSGSAPYYAYGVINDETNSDGSFVPPLLASAMTGKTRATLPVLVETGSYSTELVVSNWSGADKTLAFSWAASALVNEGHAVLFSLSVPAGQQLILPDVVETLRTLQVDGVPARGGSLSGALDVTAAAGDLAGVVLSARITTPGDGGQYGVFTTATPAGSAAATESWLYGLRQDSENRTNLALVNTGTTDSSTDTFQVDLYDGGSGAKVNTVTASLASHEWKPWNAILSSVAGTAQAYAHVTRTAGANPFIAYAVINDGASAGARSGDGAFVAAAP